MWEGASHGWGSAICSATWHRHTVTWLGHWELQVGTATALGVCPPPPTLSMMIFLCFPSPLFGVSRRNFKKNAPTCCDFWPPNHHFGLALLSAVNHKRNLIESIDLLLLSASSSEVAAPCRAVVEVVTRLITCLDKLDTTTTHITSGGCRDSLHCCIITII